MSRATQHGRDGNRPAADRRSLLPPLMPELGVFLALFALTATSVLVAFWSALGGLAILACLAIALVMAALVMTFFMHLRSAMAVMMLAGLAGVVWLAILFGLTMADYLTRPGDLGASMQTPVKAETKAEAAN
ncbi:cytochrome C oxidase subunit IV family protein [Jiella avicenniae]|uniref:Cytochrome c oxidase subunit 4 n=1 Tax=Jiella avicenniae TaxID=2907202 RepID=A0A9X1P1D0_9HYPH|nr:cytochrome C oxidase subunit IV family protein [Jiella avicenniae]MCE7027994.1 hypothetical protein [Jiella avicenniae]